METELKLELPARRHLTALVDALSLRSRVRQDNRFFDTPARQWAEQGLALRLREEIDGQATRTILTVKSARIDTNSVWATRHEWETVLAPDEALAVRAGGVVLDATARALVPADHRPAFSESQLELVGAFLTWRRVLEFEAVDGELVVDESFYPDGRLTREVELEIYEGTDPAAARDELRSQFDRLEIPWRPSSVSKRARLGRALGEARRR